MVNSSPHFVDEDLNSVPPSGIPEELRKLSRFLPVIVLIPKSLVSDKDNKDARPNRPVACSANMEKLSSPLDVTKAWFRGPGVSDTFEFGVITGCFSTMEIRRNGRPVTMTWKEFKTLQYLFKNPRKVISRDELLDEVWGYQNYPCTRTVDNHILKLRKKLETDPGHPKHFQTVHGIGYKFVL